jgi:hypothetical protein
MEGSEVSNATVGVFMPYAESRLVPDPRRCYGHTWRVVNMSLS